MLGSIQMPLFWILDYIDAFHYNGWESAFTVFHVADQAQEISL